MIIGYYDDKFYGTASNPLRKVIVRIETRSASAPQYFYYVQLIKA